MKAIVKYRRNSHERYWIFFGSWYDIQYHLEQLFKTDIDIGYSSVRGMIYNITWNNCLKQI